LFCSYSPRRYHGAELALKLEPIIAKQAQDRRSQAAGKPRGKKKTSVTQKSAEETGETRDEIAKAAGVSHDTVAKVKVIVEEADESTKEQLRKGETSINRHFQGMVYYHYLTRERAPECLKSCPFSLTPLEKADYRPFSKKLLTSRIREVILKLFISKGGMSRTASRAILFL